MRLLIFTGALLLYSAAAAAQDPMAAPPSVFLDCQTRCDSDHLRNEVRFVNWVRDRTAADVHLLITRQGTGGGGTQYELALLGRQRFAGDSVRIGVTIGQTATNAEQRAVLTSRVAQALMRYAAQTGAASRVSRVQCAAEARRGRRRGSGDR